MCTILDAGAGVFCGLACIVMFLLFLSALLDKENSSLVLKIIYGVMFVMTIALNALMFSV